LPVEEIVSPEVPPRKSSQEAISPKPIKPFISKGACPVMNTTLILRNLNINKREKRYD
jgi:hypothetical protein